MAEIPKLEDTSSDTPISSCEDRESEETGTRKIPISDQINGLQWTNIKSDSFIVDMERFSHLTDQDTTANSRLTLQRSLSRKGSPQSNEKKINSSTVREREVTVVATSSPRAAVVGASTPEKSMATDYSINPNVHHQITIMTGNIGGTTTTQSKCSGKRFSFRRSPPSWVMDPRRILLYFATLSSMGTILLIYFTLSVGQVSRDDNALDW
ncbi:hypothetical protein F0562_018924 [Nyssa sinensis]|uniref:Uncharacterized protein n=1 Tax=Nyssa sinensis TaxID=561372 RepID=A0A5J4ZA60_9ASTE|nr:hypothetical protein F0562_018924 [Nyssa sinensis]